MMDIVRSFTSKDMDSVLPKKPNAREHMYIQPGGIVEDRAVGVSSVYILRCRKVRISLCLHTRESRSAACNPSASF
jgi:hypothetical protein